MPKSDDPASDDPLEIVRTAVGLFLAGDLEGMLAYGSDDIVWHEAGSHPLAGELRGKEAVRARLEETLRLLDEFRFEIIDAVNDQGQVSVLVRWEGVAGETSTVVKAVHIHRVADGKIVETWFNPFDEENVDRFWREIVAKAASPVNGA